MTLIQFDLQTETTQTFFLPALMIISSRPGTEELLRAISQLGALSDIDKVSQALILEEMKDTLLRTEKIRP
jgi:hypothetical protein